MVTRRTRTLAPNVKRENRPSLVTSGVSSVVQRSDVRTRGASHRRRQRVRGPVAVFPHVAGPISGNNHSDIRYLGDTRTRQGRGGGSGTPSRSEFTDRPRPRDVPGTVRTGESNAIGNAICRNCLDAYALRGPREKILPGPPAGRARVGGSVTVMQRSLQGYIHKWGGGCTRTGTSGTIERLLWTDCYMPRTRIRGRRHAHFALPRAAEPPADL